MFRRRPGERECVSSDRLELMGLRANCMKPKSGLLTLLGVLLAAPAGSYGHAAHAQTVQAQTGSVAHNLPPIDNVKYLFATAEPVAHLKSGDILDTNTLDCFGNALKKPGDTLSLVKEIGRA